MCLQVGRGKKYAPSEEDCGSALKVDVIVIDTQGRQNPEIGRTFTVVTQRVKAAPEPPKRNLIPLPSQRLETAAGRFSVLTYNLLADLYANVSHSVYGLSRPAIKHLLGGSCNTISGLNNISLGREF